MGCSVLYLVPCIRAIGIQFEDGYVYINRYSEVVVLVLFILLALLWLFREPRFIPGWASIFPSKDGKRSVRSEQPVHYPLSSSSTATSVMPVLPCSLCF